MDDEVGGVGAVGKLKFLWIRKGLIIDACFEDGTSIKFENNETGWREFVTYGMLLGGQI